MDLVRFPSPCHSWGSRRTCAIGSSVTLTLSAYRPRSSSVLIRSPLVDVVAPMSLTMTARLTNGMPRPFIAMWENSRCAILRT